MLSAEELLAGSALTYEVQIPPEILDPTGLNQPNPDSKVVLRPLNVTDLQRLTRAAKENDQLLATLMVQQALLNPELSVAQVAAMHAGLVQFLLEEVNRISGISTNANDLQRLSEEPLARAAFILAKEYGWTPEQVNALTLGQVLLHLQMLRQAQN